MAEWSADWVNAAGTVGPPDAQKPPEPPANR